MSCQGTSAAFAQTLPWLPSQLHVIVVRKEGTSQTHCDFRVRRVVVLRALQWLLTAHSFTCVVEDNITSVSRP